MSEHRIAVLKAEIAQQQQRQKDFSAYPEAVEAAKRAERAAKDELAKFGGDVEVDVSLAKLKLAELVEHAESVGIVGDALEALKKPGVSKKDVLAAIEAKTAEQD